MLSRRACVLTAAIGLTLAACGTGSDSAERTVPTEPTPSESTDTALEATTEQPTDTEVAGTTEAVDTPAPEPAAADSDPAVSEPAAPEPAPATDAPPAEPAPPEAGGRAFATAVEPASQFDGNPFPDLVVEDIGRSGEANTANILPSDRPVLLWTWAPH